MKLRGHSFATLAKKLGIINKNDGKPLASGVSERLRASQEMRVDTLINFLNALDCELVIRSNTKDKTEWKVTLDEEN
jgi:hypothetical protein